MALLSAKSLKQRETGERLVDIGNGDEVMIRRPDIQVLVLKQAMPLPLLASVIKIVSEWSNTNITDMSEELIKESTTAMQFIDLWVTAAMVSPKISETGGDDSIMLADLTLATKMRIFRASIAVGEPARAAAVEAATEFPEVGPGEGTRPDVPTVPSAPVPDIIHA